MSVNTRTTVKSNSFYFKTQDDDFAAYIYLYGEQ